MSPLVTTHTCIHIHKEGDGDCTSKSWECRDLDRLFVANHYLLMSMSDSHTAFDVEAAMSLWGHDSFSGRD